MRILKLASVRLDGSRLFAVETGGRPSLQRCALPGGRRGFCLDRKPGACHRRRCSGRARIIPCFIPMRAQSRSINLSNAVALVVFEAWRQVGFERGL